MSKGKKIAEQMSKEYEQQEEYNKIYFETNMI